MLDAVDEFHAYHAPAWNQTRFVAETFYAAGRAAPSSDSADRDRELAARVLDEAYPDLHRAIALVDPTSPLAVRPAGAGAVYDRAFRDTVSTAAVAACEWDWELSYGGSWAMRQPAATPAAELVARAVALERAHEREGRLATVDPDAPSPAEAVGDRVHAHAVDVLSALETRGVWVAFGDVSSPSCRSADGTQGIVLPETWCEKPDGLASLPADGDVSDLDRLASGVVRLRLPDVAANFQTTRATSGPCYTASSSTVTSSRPASLSP